jgi:hypothetical protein
MDLTIQAIEGFNNPTGDSPYISTSANDYAFRAGKMLRTELHYMQAPDCCKMARGHSVRVKLGSLKYLVNFADYRNPVWTCEGRA